MLAIGPITPIAISKKQRIKAVVQTKKDQIAAKKATRVATIVEEARSYILLLEHRAAIDYNKPIQTKGLRASIVLPIAKDLPSSSIADKRTQR